MHRGFRNYSVGDRVETYNNMKGTIFGLQQDEIEGEFLLVRLDGHDGEYAYSLNEVQKLTVSDKWHYIKRDGLVKSQPIS